MNLYGWLWYYGSSCLWILELTVTLLSYQWSSWRLLLLSQIKTLLNFGFKCLWMKKSAKVVPPIARLVCIIYMMHAMAFFKVSIFFAGFLSLREIQKKKKNWFWNPKMVWIRSVPEGFISNLWKLVPMWPK